MSNTAMSLPAWTGGGDNVTNNNIPTNPQDYVFFLSKDEIPYGCFSNAYHEPNGGHTSSSSSTTATNNNKFWCINQELHYQKALLFNDTTTAQQILDETNDATKIKQLGRTVQNYNDDKWCEVRYNVCVSALYSKFMQNEDMKQLLLDTGTKIIVEAANDMTWGIGCVEYTTTTTNDEGTNIVQRGAKKKDTEEWDIGPTEWKGANLLGRCLMDVRKILSEESG